MSDGIKRMLAERAALAAKQRKPEPAYVPKREAEHQRNVDRMMETIKRAAPFMDEGAPPGRWRPSDKLRLLYFVSATCENNAKATQNALWFIDAMLDRARKLWVHGFSPDPWAENEKIPLDLSGIEWKQ